MKRVWVDHAGVNLLTDKTDDVHESALKLVRKGAVSGEICALKSCVETSTALEPPACAMCCGRIGN